MAMELYTTLMKGGTVNSLMLLWKVLLEELGEWCNTSTILDYKTAEKRIEHEKLSFLTITLPAFAKDFEEGLERGKVDHDLFTGFRRVGGLPAFLGGFLDLVFERKTGLLLDDPSADSIFAIRQITMVFGKIEIKASEGRDSRAVAGYIQCEKEVRLADERATSEDLDKILRVSALLLRDVFTLVDRDVDESNIVGKHGPGKTVDRLLGNQKFDVTEWPERLEREFPYIGTMRPHTWYQTSCDHVKFLSPGQERPVKVTLVPKTPKAPRVICIEPTANMFVQQGLAEKFVEYIEMDQTISGMIGFKDQGPNQVFAREGSQYGILATLDLSEASDRVSNRHVSMMLQRHPSLLRAVAAARSEKAVVPGGVDSVQLAKFASMGSALCFPFEAMVFLTMVFIGIERELNIPLTRNLISKYARKVRVYGDDIIVPVRFVDSVIMTLESYGYKVNMSKSFWNGKFRESCGKDYYDGHDVTTTRVRRVLPTDRAECEEIISAVSLRNQMYVAGLWKTAGHLDRLLEPLLRNKYPVLALDDSSIAFIGKPGSGSPLLGRQSYLGFEQPTLMHASYHTPLVKGWYVHSKIPDSPVSGEGALVKCLTKRGELPFADVDHLERSGRPKAVNIKLGWRTPF